METSEVRRRVTAAIDRAKRSAADRKSRNDEAEREYATFLNRVAVPIFRQVADSLKPAGYAFRVFTPGGSVRLMSESRAEDYIELTLDTTGNHPAVIGTSSIVRGHRVVVSERPVSEQSVQDVTEDDVLEFVTKELEAFVR